jgi:hypothetical protein
MGLLTLSTNKNIVFRNEQFDVNYQLKNANAKVADTKIPPCTPWFIILVGQPQNIADPIAKKKNFPQTNNFFPKH